MAGAAQESQACFLRAKQPTETRFCPSWMFPQKILLVFSVWQIETEGFCFLALLRCEQHYGPPEPLPPLQALLVPSPVFAGLLLGQHRGRGAGEDSGAVGWCEPKVL